MCLKQFTINQHVMRHYNSQTWKIFYPYEVRYAEKVHKHHDNLHGWHVDVSTFVAWLYNWSMCFINFVSSHSWCQSSKQECQHNMRTVPSVIWHCWLGDRNGIQSAKNLAPAILKASSLEYLWGLSITWSNLGRCRWVKHKLKVTAVSGNNLKT